MIDDGKRPFWDEALGEQMRSQISSLPLSHFHSQAVCLQPPLHSINKHRCDTFTRRTSQQFPDSFPLFIFSMAVKVVKKTKNKDKRKKKKQ